MRGLSFSAGDDGYGVQIVTTSSLATAVADADVHIYEGLEWTAPRLARSALCAAELGTYEFRTIAEQVARGLPADLAIARSPPIAGANGKFKC